MWSKTIVARDDETAAAREQLRIRRRLATVRGPFAGAAGLVSVVVLVAGCGGGATTSSASRAAAGGASTDAPVLRAGDERVFPAGELAVGSTIACVSDGLRAETQVPEAGVGVSISGITWTKDARATIDIEVLASGDVRASCE